ncbi:MAG: DUF3800 domain-containing protein [bacterium]|nr:DUF3800 domain-containing protein [bacterium]
MHIYLDESFQLKSGTENQFLTIAGFETPDPQRIAKLFNRIKKHTLPKRMSNQEVKSTNIVADRAFKPKLFRELNKEDVHIYAITQLKSQLPHGYFHKGDLRYDRLYLDLLSILLVREWDYRDSDIIITTMDMYRPTKLSRGAIIKTLEAALAEKYPDKFFRVQFQTSELLNLQLADQVCGVFYQLMQENQKWFEMLKPKLKKIVANPLSR